MANLIQIKRSITNSISNSTPVLARGELAYTQLTDTLWIGAPDGTENIRLAGRETPGILVANQALVANGTGWLNEIYAANASVSILLANSSAGTAKQMLYSSGASSNAYWADAPNTNTAADYDWTGKHTWEANSLFNANVTIAGANLYLTTDSSGSIVIGNSSVFATVNATFFTGTSENALHLDGEAASQLNVNSANYAESSNNAKSSNVATYIGNSTAYAAYTDLITTASIAAIVATLPANSATYLGNSTVYSSLSDVASSISTAYSNAMADTLSRNSTYTGKATFNANAVFNANSTFTGQSDFSGNVVVSSYVVGDLVGYTNSTFESSLGNTLNGWSALYIANNGGISIGNSSVSGVIIKNDGMNTVGGYFPANFKLADGTTQISMYDALKIPKLVAPILQANIATIDIVSSTSGNIHFTTNAAFTGNSVVLGDTTTFNANVISAGSLNLRGNFVVAGTQTTACSEVVLVHNAFIELAADNDTGDVLDTGFVVKYAVADGGGWANNFAGLYRVAGSSTSNPHFKLWGSTAATNGLTGTAADDMYRGTLQAYLEPYGTGGAFVANATAITVTANSSLAVNITANTLNLSTGLGVSSGGTGKISYTAGSLLYASATNAIGEILGGISGSLDGQVLQIVNNLPAYGTLDGGTF
jgi:hypothetical protein